MANRPAGRATRSTSVPFPRDDRVEPRWLLLIHQIPPKPDYLRVKIGRRLQRIGAVAIKNSVYVLPPSSEAYEDFQWIVREIEEGGGEAFISEASLGDGLTDAAVRARFDAARNEEYRALVADGRLALRALTQRPRSPRKKSARARAPVVVEEQELARLRRRYEIIRAIDFFDAPEGPGAAEVLQAIERALRARGEGPHGPRRSRHPEGATWVTRRDVHVDRVGSAWLIRRFVDARARFRFVAPDRYTHRGDELRFDMFEGEYTHVGDACTFEVLAREFAPGDAALRQLAEIVHDVDCKDGKFRRDEAAGLARLIAGLTALHARDQDRIVQGAALFDVLYASFANR